MTISAIIEFRNGKADTETDFGNAWGTGARIWGAIYDAFLKDPDNEYDSWLAASLPDGDNPRLWAIARDKSKPEFLRAVHAMTFTDAVIASRNFERHADHLDTFRKEYPTEGVCHLAAWAKFLRKSDADFVGFWMTSVIENRWMVHNEESDDYEPYDIAKGSGHFEVYEWQDTLQ